LLIEKEKAGMSHLSVGDLIKEHKCWDGRDETLDSYILDEDKLLDLMEPMIEEAAAVGVVADYHSVEFFPERWFDLVVVLRTNTNVLFDRLTERGYNEAKRSENMTCEIMQVILEEARESYATEIVHEVQSNTIADMDANVERLLLWIKQWIKDNNNNNSE
jgi:adenylate kinase